jgi:uncharacterized membrane protein YfcA
MDLTVAAAILSAGLLSGFVDAIAGGGGLIMIASLMLGGLPPHVAIATNKLCGVTGGVASSVQFVRARLVDWRACVVIGLPAVLGAVVGSRLISRLSADRTVPIVIGLLVVVTLWMVVKPRLGRQPGESGSLLRVGGARMIQAGALGAVFGVHEGFFGPGAGALFLFAVLTPWSASFVRGTASARVITLMTSVAALVSFFWLGAVDLRAGLLASAGTIVGGWAGASVTPAWGARIMRPLLITVTGGAVGVLVVGHVLR